MKKILSLITVLFVSNLVFAQSAKFIDETLKAETVTIGQMCYMAALTQELIPVTASETEAYNALFENAETVSSKIEKPANYATACSILAKAWNVKGGLFFTLSKKSPRYAFKQFKSDGIIHSNIDPNTFPTGQQVLTMYTNCEERYGTKTDNQADQSQGENE